MHADRVERNVVLGVHPQADLQIFLETFGSEEVRELGEGRDYHGDYHLVHVGLAWSRDLERSERVGIRH